VAAVLVLAQRRVRRHSRNAFKLRLFIEHITAAFGRVPPWDAALIERDVLPHALVE
jgi:hypothetical protein